MRATKTAIAAALLSDNNVTTLVPPAQIYAVERATLPTLPAVEVIAVSSERVGDGPMVKHALSVEITAAHSTEDGADELLDAVVRAVRQRLSAAEHQIAPIALASGKGCLVVLNGTRWSISAANASGVVRGASVALSVVVGE